MSSDPGVTLPDSIISPLDLGQIQRELFALDEFLAAKSGGKALPFMSTELKTLAKAEKSNLLHQADRTKLSNQLKFVRRTAPSVQISFAADPSKKALRVLARWFRENGHPNTLITVGVQPNIAGGCVVRTSSKTFDFSLQQLFVANQKALAERFI